ncbi:MAG: hypothetical protein IJZ82_02130 [Lachnospiraceae bacterium]|nr:hypothetical protein [Lachnospiraceae bacterium]
MKRILIIICCMLLTACGKDTYVETPNSQRPSINVGGTIYHSTGYEAPKEELSAEVLGYISSVVNLSELAEKDGEANIPFEGAPYALCGEGIAVKMDEVWTLFLPAENGAHAYVNE